MTTETNISEKSKSLKKMDDGVVFIGAKPFMNYVTGVVVQFNNCTAENKEVTIKARGKFISKAVDVAEVARRKFLKEQGAAIGKIKIDSEEFENKEGKQVNVSTIEITLKK
ncbi:MAG: DNA-binding protein Alba [archaeon]